MDVTVWSSEKMNGLETQIEMVIKWYFKPQRWMRLPRKWRFLEDANI